MTIGQSPPAVSGRKAVKPREDRLGLAVLMVAGAWLCFSFLDASAKWLTAAGLPVMQVVFTRYVTHFSLALATYVPRDGLSIFRTNAPKIQITRALFLFAGTTCNFMALRDLPLTIAAAIFFATPIMICLLSVPILGERIGVRRLAAVISGFVGVLIIIQPWGETFHWSILYSLCSLMCASFYMIFTRMVAGVDDNATSQVVAAGVATVCLVPFAFAAWEWPTETIDWIVYACIGAFGFVGHSLVTIGHRFGPASSLAPWTYIQILYVTLISWIVFADTPKSSTALGTAIIVGSGLYIWQREKQLRRESSSAHS